MARLSEIEGFVNALLQPEAFSDYAPNGVQVRGSEEVRGVVSGVSACMELFEAAHAHNAQLVLVHHGLFWEKESRVVEGSMKRRLSYLLRHDLTLMGYHLPLDAHPQVGNNAQILRRMGMIPVAPFGRYRGQYLSSVGELPEAQPVDAFVRRAAELFGGEPLSMLFGPARVRRVAVCSGGAPELLAEAVRAGADLFLTGEAAEPSWHLAREEGIHLLAVGHARSEVFGAMTVGEEIAGRFGIPHKHVLMDNPV